MKHDVFTWLVRCVIIGGFTMGGYIGERVLTKQDTLADKIEAGISEIRVLQNTMVIRNEARNRQVDGITIELADHEARLRAVERK